MTGAVDGVLPGAAHAPETVVNLWRQGVEGKRQATHPLRAQDAGQVLRDPDAVASHHDPEVALRGVADDVENVRPQQRLAAGEDDQGLGSEVPRCRR